MRAGIVCLILGYVLSQFYRAFLAVLTPVLTAELGATAEDLAAASGLWFLAFALMQIPVGEALDRIGPRRTTAVLLVIGGAGGAAVFAMAGGPGGIKLAMVLIGIGCAPVLMASYYIFARVYPPAVFGTLAGAVIGFGSLGNIASSLPLSVVVDLIGWRGALWAMGALTLVVAAAIVLVVRDPERAEGTGKGSVLDVLRIPALWPVLAIMTVAYAPAAGVRGLWTGPYYTDVFGADATAIGRATLAMGVAMVLGNFAYGPLDRMLGTRKWLVFGGNALMMLCLTGLFLWPDAGGWVTLALLCGVGLFGSSFPMVVAHGRAFVPPHLVGRGVTLINLFGIGSTGLLQIVTGRLHGALADPAQAPAAYAGLFGFYAILVALGLAIYLWSRDSLK
jgi:predicted MFS family arabinose efflux permease